MTVITCVPRALADVLPVEAARRALELNPENGQPGADPESLGNAKDKLALDITRYWGKAGVRLTVGFIDTPDQALRDRILSHMNAWGRCANVEFTASQTEPQVRIARRTEREAPRAGGYWSYVGTDLTLVRPGEPTMNLEAFTMATPDSEFYRVVRHETGHTLGFPHEHMREALVNRLNRTAVIDAYMQSQGWTEQDVIDQLLTPIEESAILATPVADETSIMCYQIDGSLTLDGQPIVGGTDINQTDCGFAAQVYPR